MSHQQITNRFVGKFDPKNQDHVKWLRDIHRSLENMDTVKLDVPEMVNQNPMGVAFRKEDMLEWVHIHFSLNFKYAKSVLEGQAWVPEIADKTPQA